MNNKHIFSDVLIFFSPLFLFRPSKAGGDQKVSLHLSDWPSSPQRGHSGWFGMVCCAVTVKFKLNCYSQFFVSLCVLQFHLNHLPCQALTESMHSALAKHQQVAKLAVCWAVVADAFGISRTVPDTR